MSSVPKHLDGSVDSLRSVGEALEGKTMVICCGSGGVGKTTTAAALGLAAARHGRRNVLVLTIDPARRLADALGLGGEGGLAGTAPSRIRGLPRGSGTVEAAMLDTSAGWDELVRRHAPDADTRDRILVNPLYRNITQRFVQSHDYIAMEQLYELHASRRHDLIVIDTPPSRHAIDFLDAPDRMADFFSSSLLKWITLPYRVGGARAGRLGYLAAKPFYQAADRILGSKFLEDIAEFFLLFQSMYDGFVARARKVTTLLHDPATAFLIVSTLEPLPLREADYFVAELTKRQLHLAAMILNRVLPTSLLDPQAAGLATRLLGEEDALLQAVASNHLRFAALATEEQHHRRRLAATPEVLRTVAHRTEDLSDVSALLALGEELWG